MSDVQSVNDTVENKVEDTTEAVSSSSSSSSSSVTPAAVSTDAAAVVAESTNDAAVQSEAKTLEQLEAEDDIEEQVEDILRSKLKITTNNAVRLGFLEELDNDDDCVPLVRQTFPSKTGGKPLWLNPRDLPARDSFQCAVCKCAMKFVLQLYAPLDSDGFEHAFHRTLYLFCCRNNKCLSQPGSIRVFRSQLPLHNEFYAAVPVKPEDVKEIDENGFGDAHWCQVCGVPAPNRCSQCKSVWYCTKEHQLLHWRGAHSVECKSPSAVQASPKKPIKPNNAAALGAACFPVSELVNEDEYDSGADDDEYDDDDEEVDSKDASVRGKCFLSFQLCVCVCGMVWCVVCRVSCLLCSAPFVVMISHMVLIYVSSVYSSAHLQNLKQKRSAAQKKEQEAKAQAHGDATEHEPIADDEEFDAETVSMFGRNKPDPFFVHFQKRTKHDPSQVLRYGRHSDQCEILWLSAHDQLRGTPPVCEHCGAERVFEFQVLPQLLYFLKVDTAADDNAMDWNTLVVYTCKNSCGDGTKQYANEFVYRQKPS
jgi:pre-rRNA-processing protein TSR4